MPRYIDAEKINYRTDYNSPIYDNCGGHCCQVGYDQVASYSEICEIPTADVAPVIHAYWKEKGVWVPLARDASPWSYDEDRYNYKTHSQKEFMWFCSNCDYRGDRSIKPDWLKYCPECGAKMDKKEQ